MTSDFALFIISPQRGAEPDLFLGAIVGRQPEFQFVESGSWFFHDTQSQRRYSIEYLRPPYIELGVTYETPKETVMRCLQSIGAFPFRISPNLVAAELPVMMSFQESIHKSTGMVRYRCTCDFHYPNAACSPDVKALLNNIAVFEREISSVPEGIPQPKLKEVRRLIDDYQSAAENISLQEGFLLPCQIENDSNQCYCLCLLGKQEGQFRFSCDLFLDKHALISEGDKLVRNIVYVGPRLTKDIEFTSEVAKIVKIHA